MSFRVDHVTIAGPELGALQGVFEQAGLAAVYGGPHSNRVTHMAALAFDDGSYIELISTLEPGQPSPWWDAHIAGGAGLCAWAVRVEDVSAEALRLASLGIAVDGPAHYQRQRPDGVSVAWDLAFVGEGRGATLPFLIADRTPREHRVRPSPSVAGSELTGIELVLLGVEALAAASELFERAYGLAASAIHEWPALGVRVARFEAQPFALAAPATEGGWLAERLRRFGPCPCACLIGTRDLEASRARRPLGRPLAGEGRRVAWFDGALERLRLGVVE